MMALGVEDVKAVKTHNFVLHVAYFIYIYMRFDGANVSLYVWYMITERKSCWWMVL